MLYGHLSLSLIRSDQTGLKLEAKNTQSCLPFSSFLPFHSSAASVRRTLANFLPTTASANAKVSSSSTRTAPRDSIASRDPKTKPS